MEIVIIPALNSPSLRTISLYFSALVASFAVSLSLFLSLSLSLSF